MNLCSALTDWGKEWPKKKNVKWRSEGLLNGVKNENGGVFRKICVLLVCV